MKLKKLLRKIMTAVKDWLVGDNPYEPDPAKAEPLLNWCHGGFDGSRALEDPAVQIGGLRVSASGMSYSWTAGDLSVWGLARTDALALACIFYFDGSEWRGGKFDWISTSRLTRDFKNIDGGYHGWDAAAFRAAKRYAFCIVSNDGKKRTNIIEG